MKYVHGSPGIGRIPRNQIAKAISIVARTWALVA